MAAATIPRGATHAIKETVAGIQIRPDRAEPDAEGTDDEDQGGHHRKPRPSEGDDLLIAHIGRQDHEEQPDQHHRQLILELAQVAFDRGARVSDDNARDRDRQHAAMGEQHLGSRIDQQHAREDRDVLETFRQESCDAQHAGDQESTDRAEDQARREARDTGAAMGEHDPTGFVRKGKAQDHDREDRADRIDQDALGFEHRRNPRLQSQHRNQRPDHRRPRDDHESPEEERLHQTPTEPVLSRRRTTDQRHDGAHGDQAPDGDAFAPQTRHLEVQSALEEDDRHGKIDDREEARAELTGLDPAEPVGTEADTGDQEDHDSWKADMACEGLGKHARQQREGEGELRIEFVAGHVTVFSRCMGFRRSPQ